MRADYRITYRLTFLSQEKINRLGGRAATGTRRTSSMCAAAPLGVGPVRENVPLS